MSFWDEILEVGEDIWEGIESFGDGILNVFGLGEIPTVDNSRSMSDRKVTVRSSATPRKVIYGTARVGGQVVYLESDGDDDRYMHIIVVFAAHSCKAIRKIYFGDDVAFGTLGDLSGLYPLGDYGSNVEFHIETGKQTGVPSKILQLTPDNWTSSHKLLGQTYAYFRLEYNKDLFQGIPQITALIDGKDDIDLGDGTTGWTDNHGLCVKDYLLWDRGFRAEVDELDMPSFERAAAVADEPIGDESWAGVGFLTGGNGSYFERRYTINGSFELNAPPLKTVESMLVAGAATMTYSQGVWSITPGAYQEPVAHYDESDLIGGVQFTPGASKGDRINTATGTIISPGHNYEETDFVPISVPSYLGRDGEELTVDLSLPFTNSSTQARRIGKIMIERSRFGVGAQATLKHYAIDRKIGQRIRLSISTLGWVGKVFRISDVQFSLSSGVTLALREDSEAIYTWEEGENLVVPVPPAISLPNARFVTPPKFLAIVEDSYQNTNGDTRVRANFLYQAGGASTGAYDVEYKLQSATTWQRAYSAWTDTRAQISDLPPGAYTFRVRGINGIGIKSEWASINHAFEGIENYWPLPVADMVLQELTDTPPSPRAQFSTIRATITPPTDPLFSHALIEYQLDGDAAWVVSGPTDVNDRRDIIVLTDGLGYRVRAFSVSTTGITSATPITRSLGVSDIDNPSDLPNIAPLNAVIGLGVEGGGTSFSGKNAKIIWQDPNRGSLYVREYAIEIRTPGGALMRSTVAAVPDFVYTAEANAEDYERLNGSAGLYRQFNVAVKVIGQLDDGTRTHESQSASVLIENPAPSLPTNLSVAAGYELIKVAFDKPTDLDYTETRIWLGTNTGFTPSDSNLAAVTYGGPVTISGLDDDTDYFVRVATYDAYGKGPTSSELAKRTASLGLSPWAFVNSVDRAFIEANVELAAIPGEYIGKIVAGQIATGTLGATDSISAGDPLTKPYTVTLGGKSFSSGVALISVEQNATGDAIFAAFESGRVQLNENANVFPDGGLLFGSQNGIGDYLEFDASTGRVSLSGELVAASGTFSGALSAATGTFSGALQAATGSFSGSLSAASGTFSGSISTPGLTIASNGDLTSSGNFSFGSATDYIKFNGTQVTASKFRSIGDIYIGSNSASIGFLTPWTGYVGAAIQDIYGKLNSPSVGEVDSYALLRNNTASNLSPGATLAGSNLTYVSAVGLSPASVGDISPTGSWRLMGSAHDTGNSAGARTSLWMRYA